MKNTHLPWPIHYIVFQVLKVLLIKNIPELKVVLLYFLLYIIFCINQQISFFTSFQNFSQHSHYLKKDFWQIFLFYNGFTPTTSPSQRSKSAKNDKSCLLMHPPRPKSGKYQVPTHPLEVDGLSLHTKKLSSCQILNKSMYQVLVPM